MMLPPDWKPRGPAGMARPQVSAEDLDGVSRNSEAKSGNVDLSKTYNSAKEYISALNANEEKDLVAKFGIKQAPTLVLVNDEGFEKYRGVSDIKGWLMKQ